MLNSLAGRPLGISRYHLNYATRFTLSHYRVTSLKIVFSVYRICMEIATEGWINGE